MRRGFADQYRRLFSAAIELHHQAGRSAEALETAEQARARAFLDLLAASEVQPRSAEPLSAAQVASAAARLRSTILAYWVNPDATFLWVVPPSGAIQGLRVAVAAERLEQLVRQAGPGAGPASKPGPRLRGGDVLFLDDSQKKAWRELDRLLIEPARRLLSNSPGSRLTIIPHGPLFRLSFAALEDAGGRYLLERHTLHYAPSAAVLEFVGRKRQTPAVQPSRYLLIADPTPTPASPDGRQLPALPGARQEVQAIARLVPAGAVTVLAGAQAREQTVRSLAPQGAVIHFATHGVLQDDQPFDSFLALGSASGAASNDGRLTAQEIYELDLQADLVVLSACRTGLGKISGDGIAGLTRAFFYAGTPSVMATLWDVADEPTSRLVAEFYRSYQRTHDKSQALRAAQLHLLRALRNGQVKATTPAGTFTLPEHPVFWAGFVLVGEP
jgi:CHAT domain-containing protein